MLFSDDPSEKNKLVEQVAGKMYRKMVDTWKKERIDFVTKRITDFYKER